jgi:hypothetical protein
VLDDLNVFSGHDASFPEHLASFSQSPLDSLQTVPDAKKVKSSHTKGTATFLAEDIDETKLIQAIADTGYTAQEVSSEEYKKKGLFFH